jgi:hypothetical protein
MPHARAWLDNPTRFVWQGCQMVCFKIKNQNLGKILEDLAMEDDGIFYGHLVHFTVFCYILSTFGIPSSW